MSEYKLFGAAHGLGCTAQDAAIWLDAASDTDHALNVVIRYRQ